MDEDSAMLVLSTNDSRDWKLIARLPGKSVRAIFPCSVYGRPGEVVVFTESACVNVHEATGEVTRLPLPVENIIAVEGGQNSNGSLFYIQSGFEDSNGTTKGGMYVSRDLGVSWTFSNNGLFKDVPEGKLPSFRRGLAVCETQPDVAYISTINPVKNSEGNVPRFRIS